MVAILGDVIECNFSIVPSSGVFSKAIISYATVLIAMRKPRYVPRVPTHLESNLTHSQRLGYVRSTVHLDPAKPRTLEKKSPWNLRLTTARLPPQLASQA